MTFRSYRCSCSSILCSLDGAAPKGFLRMFSSGLWSDGEHDGQELFFYLSIILLRSSQCSWCIGYWVSILKQTRSQPILRCISLYNKLFPWIKKLEHRYICKGLFESLDGLIMFVLPQPHHVLSKIFYHAQHALSSGDGIAVMAFIFVSSAFTPSALTTCPMYLTLSTLNCIFSFARVITFVVFHHVPLLWMLRWSYHLLWYGLPECHRTFHSCAVGKLHLPIWFQKACVWICISPTGCWKCTAAMMPRQTSPASNHLSHQAQKIFSYQQVCSAHHQSWEWSNAVSGSLYLSHWDPDRAVACSCLSFQRLPGCLPMMWAQSLLQSHQLAAGYQVWLSVCP